MADLLSLLQDQQNADSSPPAIRAGKARAMALSCYRRLAGNTADNFPDELVVLAKDELIFLIREIEAVEQALSQDCLSPEMAMQALAGFYSSLIKWALATDVLSDAELLALLAHRRHHGHPYAAKECAP